MGENAVKDNITTIFFDCMETIVDLYELPSASDYALWAFAGSGVEQYWGDFNEFWMMYRDAKRELITVMEPDQEHEMRRRLELVIDKTKTIDTSSAHQVIQNLYNNFWSTYKSKCFIDEEIMNVLPELGKRYKLAVVSNFMIQDGIEELLKLNRASSYFDFVVTSINEGWKKPSPKIYEASLQYADCPPEQVLFVGDDYENDVVAPRRMGMKSILLEKDHKRDSRVAGSDKVKNFNELKTLLLK
jgi:putative hydrolase of the HAD superfamily